MRYFQDQLGVRATFPCLHRYTGRAICAVPCDGIDDMCENYADEDNCNIPNFIDLLIQVTLLTLVVGIASIALISAWRYLFQKKELETEGPIISIPWQSIGMTVDEQKLSDLVESGYMGKAMQNLMYYLWNTEDVIFQRSVSKELYCKMARKQEMESDLNIFFLKNLGTNASIGRLYDLVDESVSVKMETFFYHKLPSRIHRMLCSSLIRMVKIVMSKLVNVSLYYTDIYKDIYLAHLIYTQVIVQPSGFTFKGKESFPTIVFFVIVASIAATEVCNIVIFISHSEFGKWSFWKWLPTITCAPLMPAFIEFEGLIEEIRLYSLARKIKSKQVVMWGWHKEALLERIRDNICALRSLLYEFRASENSFEHFVQPVLLILILQLSKTTSPIVSGFNKVFLDEASPLVYMSAISSLKSLVAGHIYYLSITKNDFLGLTAKLILIPYYLIGSASQIFRVLLIFTPLMGLFDTMHHYLKGIMEMENINLMYEPLLNLTYTQLWNNHYRLREFNEFFSLPSVVYFVICGGCVILHLSASNIFLRPFCKKLGDGWVRISMRTVVTLVNIPLFCDWEEFFRYSDHSIPVSECWNKCKKLYAKFQVLFLIEHMMSLIPIICLKIAVDKRNAKLEEGPFKLVPDEELSTYVVNCLLVLGVVMPVITALIQASLAYLYFMYGHPWARVLKSQVFPK